MFVHIISYSRAEAFAHHEFPAAAPSDVKVMKANRFPPLADSGGGEGGLD